MTDEKYFTVQRASNFLTISVSTLNRLIKSNRIPSYKIGARRLLDRDELIEWVKTHRKGKGK